MYVAERPIKVTEHGPKGERSVKTIPVGERVPVVEDNWAYSTIVAHLNNGLMRWEDEDGVAHAPHLSHHFTTVDMKGYQNAGRVKKAAPQIEPKPKHVSVRVDDRGRRVDAVPTLDPLKCEPCAKTFKNTAGLANHRRLVHTPKPPKEA